MGLKKVNITIDNVDPLIAYAPAAWWLEGTTADPSYSQYSNQGTFTLTQQTGANASFTFHGTAIWVYGAKRSNHGPYSISIDGLQYSDNGYATPDLFKQVLFYKAVDNGLHTVTLTDTGTNITAGIYLDIDFITYETEIDDQQASVTYQDTDFSYSGGWSTNPSNLGSYSGGTGHTTTTTGSYVTYTFQGSAVQIYGAVGPDSGGYIVQVDNGTFSPFNATKSSPFYQILLYETNSLNTGTHTVKLINQPFANGQRLNIDYAIVVQSASASTSSKLGGGAIGGIVAGACVAIALLSLALYCVLRRRGRRKETTEEVLPIRVKETSWGAFPSGSASVPENRPLVPLRRNPSSNFYRSESSGMPLTNADEAISSSDGTVSSGNSEYSPGARPSSTAATIADLPLSYQSERIATAEVSSTSQSSRSTSRRSRKGRAALPPHSPSSQTDSTTITTATPTTTTTTTTSSSPTTPPTVSAPPTESPADLLLATRMRVEGRPQDFGPVVLEEDVHSTLDDLPPDYAQATQPFV